MNIQWHSQIHNYMEENSKSFIKYEGRITTQLSDLASSSQHQSPLHLMKRKITQQYNAPS